MNNEILNHQQVELKLNRLAFEIFEKNHLQNNIIIAGIMPRGNILAQHIKNRLEKICDKNISYVEVFLNKDNPSVGNISIDLDKIDTNHATVIICDDVLYTGRTLAYACYPFLEKNVKSIQCLVLVNRNHKTFPIAPLYVGLELSTTRAEHVTVELNEVFCVYVSEIK